MIYDSIHEISLKAYDCLCDSFFFKNVKYFSITFDRNIQIAYMKKEMKETLL